MNKKKIAIVGLPNTGKSQVFNNLTDKYSMTGNYAFTTVETQIGKCTISGTEYEVMDTPGLHCLYIHSEEELSVRDMLITEKPDVILQCIDANRLKQSLTLTSDLLELGIPMVISLNAIDETTKKGVWIDSTELSRRLGVEVVESVAISGLGNNELKSAINKARTGNYDVDYGGIIEDGIKSIAGTIPENINYKRKVSLLFLLDDPFIKKTVNMFCGQEKSDDILKKAADIRKKFGGNLGRTINRKKNEWVDDIYTATVKKQKLNMSGFSQTFGNLSRHPIFGIPILLVIVTIMYFGVVDVANGIAGWMNDMLWVPIEGAVNSLIPQGLVNEFLIGDYGVLTLGVSNALLTVVPILSVFFLLFNTLEDIGYMPNLCVLTKNIFSKVGLSGSAIMPITLGFGCKTMATMATKSLKSKKERYISIFLIAFALPCAAQMALNMSILGRIGAYAFVISFGFLVFIEIVAGLVLNKIIKDDNACDFIQELPQMRLPSPKIILKKTYYKLVGFLHEALPVFIAAAITLFLFDKLGILDALKNLLRPVIIGYLGFPIKMVDVLILCMAKHEAAAGMIMGMVNKGELNNIQCMVAVALTTMFVPCFANIMAMIKELGAKVALRMVVIINGIALFFAGILNWILIFTLK
ncbi:MAG: ferrous iron transport protein B [Candidatus Omnitrophica bacterium]|nr:ferrous iron transport protein B [Candidatus Omnitrophota bacterium]